MAETSLTSRFYHSDTPQTLKEDIENTLKLYLLCFFWGGGRKQNPPFQAVKALSQPCGEIDSNVSRQSAMGPV